MLKNDIRKDEIEVCIRQRLQVESGAYIQRHIWVCGQPDARLADHLRRDVDAMYFAEAFGKPTRHAPDAAADFKDTAITRGRAVQEHRQVRADELVVVRASRGDEVFLIRVRIARVHEALSILQGALVPVAPHPLRDLVQIRGFGHKLFIVSGRCGLCGLFVLPSC